jgi:tRNA(Ile)-lysidine synthase
MTLLDRFGPHLSSLGLNPGRALVAVSGGPDSVALLDLLVRSRGQHQLGLTIAHLDHGIHPESGRVAGQVRTLAESYRLPAEIGRLDLGPTASETLARDRRYQWLEATRARVEADLIFTAHHADDQIETVLMRVLAGSGPAGLAGMAAVQGRVIRPLLPFRRAELVNHLREAGLDAWVDPANTDPRHLRSWIRTSLLPALRQRLPEVDASIQRLSGQASRDRAAWDAMLDVLPGLELSAENEGISVAAPSLGGYDSALTQAVILAAARRAGCRLGPARIGRVVSLLQSGTSGARVPLGDGWMAELAFDRLRIVRNAPVAEGPWPLQGERGAGTWGRWGFQWKRDIVPERQSRAGLSAWFTTEALTVRAWSPGEKLMPLGGAGRRLIVRCFQELRVPRSRRPSWPVLARAGEIIWIPGVCRSDALIPRERTEALRVDAEYA